MKNYLIYLFGFNRQFFYCWGVLMEAGLSATRSLTIAAGMTGSIRIKNLATKMETAIKNGSTISDAMEETRGFTLKEITIMAVHEMAGSAENGALRLGQ